MTRDERIAQIRAWERSGKATALFDIYADVRFLLAELDAATARAECEVCTWTEDEDGTWHTACGRTWTFFDDGPVENRVKYCIKCGHPVVAVAYVPEEETPA